MDKNELLRFTRNPYIVTTVIIALAAVLRIWPLHILETRVAWLTFYPAVMIAAAYGGLFSGLLGTALACFTVVFLWPVLTVDPFIQTSADWVAMGGFIVSSALISYIAEAMRRARAKLKQNEEVLKKHRNQLEELVKERTRELYRSEERYRDLLDNANDLIQSISPDGHFIYTNRKWQETLGYSDKDIPRLTLWDIVHPDYLTHCREAFQRVLSGETMSDVDLVYVTRDARLINVEGSSTCRFENGKPVATRGIYRDVTERKQIERELIQSEKLYSDIANSSLAGIFIVQDGNFIFVNPQFCETTGYEEKELIGLPSMNLVHPDDRDKVRENAIKMLKGQSSDSYEYRSFTKAGETKMVMERVTSIQYRGTRASLGIYIDVTELKLAEEKLRNINAILLTVRNINQLIVKTLDEPELLQKACEILVDGRNYKIAWIGFVSEGSYDIKPVAQAGFKDGYLSSIKITWDDSEYGRGPTGTAVRTEQLFVMRDIANDERFQPWREEALKRGYASCASLPLRVDNRVIGALNVYSARADAFDQSEVDMLSELAGDISLGIQTIRQQEALRHSEERFRLMVQEVKDYAILMLDTEGRLLTWNEGAERIKGYKAEEIIGRHISKFYSDDDIKNGMPEHVLKMAASEGRFEGEGWRVRKDGSRFWANVTVTAIKNDTGKLIGYCKLIRDLTERKRSDEELRQTSEDLRLINSINNAINSQQNLEAIIRLLADETKNLFPSFGATIYLLSEDKKALIMQNLNLASTTADLIEKMAGMKLSPTRIELKSGTLYTNVLETGKPQIIQDRETIQQLMSEHTESGILKRLVPRFYQILGIRSVIIAPLIADTECIGLLDISSKDRAFSQSDLIRLETIARQLTMAIKRKQAEEALRISEEKLRLIFDSLSLGVSVNDLDGKITDVNEAKIRMHGYRDKKDIIGRNVSDFTAPKDRALTSQNRQRLLAGGTSKNIEFTFLTRDGKEFPVQANMAVLRNRTGNPIGTVTISEDITEKKLAEEAARQNDERMKVALAPIDMAIFNQDLSLRYTWMYQPQLGYTPEQIVGKTDTELLPPNAARLATEIKRMAIENGAGSRGEVEVVWKDQVIYYDLVVEPLRNSSGEIVGITGASLDITERKLAEEKLKSAEENYRNSLNDSPLGIHILSENGDLLFANKATLDIYGYGTIDELMNTPLKERLIAQSYAEHQARIELRRQGEPARSNYEMSIVRKSGEIRQVSVSHKEVLWNGKTEIQLIYQDITERKQAEENNKKMQAQLIAQDRLASIGQLAAGIAHEMNNPLTSIIGFSELTMNMSGLTDEIKGNLDIINKEASRTAGVVRGLLTFARRQKTEKETVQITQIIQEVLKLRAYEHRVSNIEVETSFAAGLPAIFGNAPQLQQVFINLIVNAEQAMLEANKKGKLTITAGQAGDIIRVSVADDGPGISRENMEKLFTPFFTTKGVGKGTGLGLSVCHGIINEHGGAIRAESEPGKGATFIIELPVHKPG